MNTGRSKAQKVSQTQKKMSVSPTLLSSRIQAYINRLSQRYLNASNDDVSPINKKVVEKIRDTITNVQNIDELNAIAEIISNNEQRQKYILNAVTEAVGDALSASDKKALLEDEDISNAMIVYFSLTKRRVYLSSFIQKTIAMEGIIKKASDVKTEFDKKLASINEEKNTPNANIATLQDEIQQAFMTYYKEIEKQRAELDKLIIVAAKDVNALFNIAGQSEEVKQTIFDKNIRASIGSYNKSIADYSQSFNQKTAKEQTKENYYACQYRLAALAPKAAEPVKVQRTLSVDANAKLNTNIKEKTHVEINEDEKAFQAAIDAANATINAANKEQAKKSQKSSVLKFLKNILDIPSIGLSVIVETAISIGKAIASAFKSGKKGKYEPLIAAEDLQISGSTKVIQQVVPPAADKGFREAVHAIENNDVLATNEAVLASKEEVDAFLVAEFAKQNKEQAAGRRPVMTN